MAKKFDLYEALLENGFNKGVDRFGREELRKDYSKEVEVAWIGMSKYRYSVAVVFNAEHTVATAYYFECGGKTPHKVKTHLNEKRAFNAIKETVKHHGFEL